jgi:hypothetical protein
MTKSKQDKVASPATTDSTSKSRLGHWMRVVVSLLSFGFIFPNSMTEDDDIVKRDIGKEAMVKK